jgi:hypothetical protein
MGKPAPIMTGQAYGACSVWRAYWGSRACGGVRSPYARAPTPIRMNGAGRKEPRLCGVGGVMTLLWEGRGCCCPSLPCRLLCRGAGDVFPSHGHQATPDTRVHGSVVLARSAYSALSTTLAASSDALRLRLRHLLQPVLQVRSPCQSLWTTAYNIIPPSPEGCMVLWVTSPPVRPLVQKAE